MSLRCRVGDLAIIVKSGIPENLGLIVDVVKYLGTIDTGVVTFHDLWIVRPRGMARNVRGEWREPGSVGVAEDRSLKPIRPPGEPAERERDDLGTGGEPEKREEHRSVKAGDEALV